MTEHPNEELLSSLMPFSTDTAKDTFRRLWPVFAAEVVLTGLMLGVYALTGHFSAKALWGALLGAGLSMANFCAMALSLLRGEHKGENPEKTRLIARGGTLLRMLVLFGLLFCALKFWALDPLATLLPLILMRISLFAAAFGGEKKEAKK